MKQPTKITYSEDQVMMTLSAIAYTSFDSLLALQEKLDDAAALEQNYIALWFSKTESNLVYVATNRVKDDYAIAIRGPLLQFGLPLLIDLYDSMEIGHHVPLSYNTTGGAKIAAGIMNAIQKINEPLFNRKTLSQEIKSLHRGAKIFVTGHGLGGTLAAALAVDLMSSNFSGRDIIPYTFAAPTAGNHAFADLFNLNNEYCLFSYSSDCAGSLDIIPFLWHDVQAIRTVDYEKIKCPPALLTAIDFVSRLISRMPYARPAKRLELKEKAAQNDGFFMEAEYQHQPDRYLALLGLDPLVLPSTGVSSRPQGKVLTVNHPHH